VVNVTPQSLYPWLRDLVAIAQETDCTPGLVCMGAENPVPTEILFLDRQPVASPLPTTPSQPTLKNEQWKNVTYFTFILGFKLI
jgi:hypothetical protein